MNRFSLAFTFLLLSIIFMEYNCNRTKNETKPSSSMREGPSKVQPAKEVKKPQEKTPLVEDIQTVRGNEISVVSAKDNDEADFYKKDPVYLKEKKTILKYFNPALQKILAHPVNCKSLEDDENAFNELKLVYSRNKPALDFLDPNLVKRRRKHQASTEEILNATRGHITFSYLNQSTVEALYLIWKKYPCSEAAPIALLAIDDLFYHPLGIDFPVGFNDESNKLCQYIIANYPNTWQGELAKNRYYGHNLNLSDQMMENFKDLIEFSEKNRVWENKYEIFYMNKIGAEYDFSADYRFLSYLYLQRCEQSADRGLKENGKIPKEAIDMYNNHLENEKLLLQRHAQYPLKYSMLSRCHELIRDHAPEHYKGEPGLE